MADQDLALCRHGGRTLSLLFTRDNKRDYDNHGKVASPFSVIPQTRPVCRSYLRRAKLRNDIYVQMRQFLLFVPSAKRLTTNAQIDDYVTKTYWVKVAETLGPEWAKPSMVSGMSK